MSNKPKILAFCGSLRRDSWNKKALKIAVQGAQNAGAEVIELDLKTLNLPVYDGDAEESDGMPPNAVELQDAMLASDGFLIASPEYNSSLSAALKNALDWASRGRGEHKPGAAFAGKVASIMAASPGGLGGLRGLLDLRKIIASMGVIVLPEEFAAARAHELFDENGAAKDEKVKATLERLGANAAEMIANIKK